MWWRFLRRRRSQRLGETTGLLTERGVAMNEIPNLPPGLRVVVQGDVEANQAWVDLWVRVLVAMREGMPEELAEKPPAMTAQLAKVIRGALERVGAENLRRRNIVSGPEIVSATIENEGKRANMLLEIGSAIPMYWLQLEYQTVDARLANVAQKFPASDTDNQSNLSISISPSSYAQPPGPVGSIVDERLSPIPLLVKGVQFEVTARAVLFDGDWERHRMPEPYIPQVVVLFGLNGVTPATKLSSIDLSKVGPAATLSFAPLASRLNVITGDNGLGKSFLTDIVWWALTETWAGAGTWTGFKAQPSDPDDATISAETVCGDMSDTMIARWDRRAHRACAAGRPCAAAERARGRVRGGRGREAIARVGRREASPGAGGRGRTERAHGGGGAAGHGVSEGGPGTAHAAGVRTDRAVCGAQAVADR